MRQYKQSVEQALIWFMRVVILLMIGAAVIGGIRSCKVRIDKKQAAKYTLLIWNYSYPRAGLWEPEADPYSVSGFLGNVWNRQPLYRFLQIAPKETALVKADDPSYQNYQEQQAFFQEHEYLFQYGAEDSNATEYQTTMEDTTGILVDATKTTPAHTVRSQLPILGTQYVKEQLADYDYLMKNFYSVHSSTTADRKVMNANNLLSKDLTIQGDNQKPQILIYHSHSQETYADYDVDHPDRSVVGIGTYLTELLEAKGYSVIHDTSVYDLQRGKLDRNQAYNFALEGISGILQENPSIEVVLDIHRDGVNEDLHMVSEVNGKATAPIMFFNGMSQTPEGPIEYLNNPYREDNLAFSLRMQLDAAAYFPGLTRKIYLKGLRYNQHLRPKSALIEVGAQTNTYEEAHNAMEPLAELLDMVLQGQ